MPPVRSPSNALEINRLKGLWPEQTVGQPGALYPVVDTDRVKCGGACMKSLTEKNFQT